MATPWLNLVIFACLLYALPTRADALWRLTEQGHVLKTDYFEVTAVFSFTSSSYKNVYEPHLERIAGSIPELEAQLDAKPELYPLKPGERIKLNVRLTNVPGGVRDKVSCLIDLRIPSGRILYEEYTFPNADHRAELYSKVFARVRESLVTEYTLQADPMLPYRQLVQRLGVLKVELTKRNFENRTAQTIVDNLAARLRKIPEPPNKEKGRRKWARRHEGTVEQVLAEMTQWPALFKLELMQSNLKGAAGAKPEFEFIHPKDIRTRQLLGMLDARLYSPDFFDLFEVVHETGGRFTMQATTQELKRPNPYAKTPGSYRIKGSLSVVHPKLTDVSIPFEFNVTSVNLETSQDWHEQFADEYEARVTGSIKSTILEHLDRPPLSANCTQLLTEP